jgi:hypothetical protein
MNKGMQRKCFLGHENSELLVNVFDVLTKKIVFTGNASDAANHLRISRSHLNNSVKRKSRIKRKYAVRIKKDGSN